MRQTLEQQQKSLASLIKYRRLYTCVGAFIVATSVDGVFHKRSQWPFIIRFSLPSGVPIWHSAWENIFTIVGLSFVLISWWVRIHNYRRELLLAEQLALQKAAQPPEGVWPPPPL